MEGRREGGVHTATDSPTLLALGGSVVGRLARELQGRIGFLSEYSTGVRGRGAIVGEIAGRGPDYSEYTDLSACSVE